MERIAGRYQVSRALLFGSRARETHSQESDADIAVILPGQHGRRTPIALEMAGIAFDVLLETGVLVEALPLWEDEMDHPELFSNPALIKNILREGIPV
ncbi:nucleotidyltransferase family protein [Trinickia symbiotica]|uniref:Nucleotidyltransferase n=1 Tax=Trinickia symbiotica TaxID=863227 RepID=A0A2N7WVD1_9BURK|nr:nucleotidyltransferase domain-containing protein [Trinickia symbiotica]PMS33436.1 nucleotidyltransferase [Trinickia symbiotica]